jgi:hypothetical protein
MENFSSDRRPSKHRSHWVKPTDLLIGNAFGTLGVRPFAVRLPELRAPIGLHDSEDFRYWLAICRLSVYIEHDRKLLLSRGKQRQAVFTHQLARKTCHGISPA